MLVARIPLVSEARMRPEHFRKQAELTEEERRAIRALAPSNKELGRVLGMSPVTVANILTPYGRACSSTIERVRAKLTELKSA